MTKLMRLFLILVLIGIGAWFLYPTVNWYFMTSQDMKDLANGSREEIRLWAVDQANADVEELRKLSKDEEAVSSPIPEKFSFLIPIAKENYKLANEKVPKEWTLSAVLNGFRNFDDVREAAETYYRQSVLDLKDMKKKILALGLDLSGGLSVVLEPDFTDMEKNSGKVLSDEEKSQAIDSALEIINNRIDTFGVTEPQIRKQLNGSILIEIPGEADPERVNAFLMGKGSLGFYIVDDEGTAKIREYVAGGGKIVDRQTTEYFLTACRFWVITPRISTVSISFRAGLSFPKLPGLTVLM